MPKRKAESSKKGNNEKEVTPAAKKDKAEGSSEETSAEASKAYKFENYNLKDKDGKEFNLKLLLWNVAGIKAWVKKNGLVHLGQETPDIICLQETKCYEKDAPSEIGNFKREIKLNSDAASGYYMYWAEAEKKGYSGVSVWSKVKPTKVNYGIGVAKFDTEGRTITAEYENFYLVTTYVPNSGRGLVRLDFRQEWDKALREYVKGLDSKKPVILCGDMNVAHTEIDLANPKSNKKNAGFTQEERDGFTELLNAGFVDTFRHLNPGVTGAYSFWTFMGNARERNIGWRLDYFVCSERLLPKVCDHALLQQIKGSDHCPLVLLMSM